MIYQKLMVGKDPFLASVGTPVGFPAHRHMEIELSYCVEGSFCIIVEKKRHSVHAGDLVVVAPMAAHEPLASEEKGGKRLTVMVGPAMLGELFGLFTAVRPEGTVVHLRTCGQKEAAELEKVLVETAGLLSGQETFGNLLVKGNVFRMSGLLLQMLSQREGSDRIAKALSSTEKIEKSLELIHEHFRERLDIDYVSRLCGYGKSNFCKIFKSIVGDTFHNVLNAYRVQIACMHLENGDMPIEEIACQVGFADVKSFCRVFKKVTGETASDYRKRCRN